jgi:hypothetical protein
MNVKRIGSVLMVGLLLLSAMVVLVGTAAAANRWEIQFEGTIEGVGAGVLVEIERTEGGYTQTWSNETDSTGYFKTDKVVFYPVSVPHYPTSAFYQLYIGGVPAEGRSIGIPYDSWEVGATGEFHGPYMFTWYGGDDCYYIYNWKTEYIPEFSTIAIPVASILGLLFFFNRRKHRKE